MDIRTNRLTFYFFFILCYGCKSKVHLNSHVTYDEGWYIINLDSGDITDNEPYFFTSENYLEAPKLKNLENVKLVFNGVRLDKIALYPIYYESHIGDLFAFYICPNGGCGEYNWSHEKQSLVKLDSIVNEIRKKRYQTE